MPYYTQSRTKLPHIFPDNFFKRILYLYLYLKAWGFFDKACQRTPNRGIGKLQVLGDYKLLVGCENQVFHIFRNIETQNT